MWLPGACRICGGARADDFKGHFGGLCFWCLAFPVTYTESNVKMSLRDPARRLAWSTLENPACKKKIP